MLGRREAWKEHESAAKMFGEWGDGKERVAALAACFGTPFPPVNLHASVYSLGNIYTNASDLTMTLQSLVN